MSKGGETVAEARSAPVDESIDDLGASPTRLSSPELRFEAKRALVWVGVVGAVALAVYISQSLLIVFGALVFASMLDGGARLIGKVLPIGRGWRILLVVLLTILFFVWLGYFAGSQIAQEAAALPGLVTQQIARATVWLEIHGVRLDLTQLEKVSGQLISGVGTVTKAIGGVMGGLASVLLIVIIGLYIALEPRLYDRGVAWLLPPERRPEFHQTTVEMAATMRRLMAGRLVGMVFEGVFTFIMLYLYGVPLAALLGILTGLLAFIPNIGAPISGALMVMVGFSGGIDMGIYTIIVYFVVQNIDGYVVIPLIARRTVNLAPAPVLAAQLIMGVLFGIIGIFLADPLLAMIKVWLERRSKRAEALQAAEAEPAAA